MEWGLRIPLNRGRARVHDTTVPIDAPTSGAFCFDTAHMPSVAGGVVDITGTVGASAITIVDALIAHGYHAQVSDVHIDPTPDHVIVRMRIDGQLSDVYTIPSTLHTQIISRIKVLAGLRIDEHMTPHDGRFRTDVANKSGESVAIDVRVSITPTYYGENAVMRLLIKTNAIRTIDDLGLSVRDRGEIDRALAQPYGLIIVTGPTGSGKTTTLYTLLERLNTPDVSIVTLEDPIEYAIPNVRQIQINPATGFTFGTGLRSVVRQDPDIVMVGEIRDTETARLAINTALTGHLVLTTLHTNDAVGCITRLIDMGVEPYLISSTVSVVVAQRLVRRVCSGCTQKYALSIEDRYMLSKSIPESAIDSHAQCYKGRGCGECRGTGYRGRSGVYELLSIDEHLRSLIVSRHGETEMRAYTHTQGSRSVVHDAYGKACRGLTSVQEVVRLHHE